MAQADYLVAHFSPKSSSIYIIRFSYAELAECLSQRRADLTLSKIRNQKASACFSHTSSSLTICLSRIDSFFLDRIEEGIDFSLSLRSVLVMVLAYLGKPDTVGRP